MPHLSVLYSRTRDPAAALIRLAAWGGPWSHCALIDGDRVIEATLLGKGVRSRSLLSAVANAWATERVDIECPDPEAGLRWAWSVVGQPYDWTGIAGIAARRRQWAADGAWYCSELVERALIEAGRTRFRDVVPGVSPTMSYYAR